MKIWILFFLSSLFAFYHAYLNNYKTYTNFLHTKQMLYFCRCVFSGLKLSASHKWWVMVSNMHHKSIFHLCVLMKSSHHIPVVQCLKNLVIFPWKYGTLILQGHTTNSKRKCCYIISDTSKKVKVFDVQLGVKNFQ